MITRRQFQLSLLAASQKLVNTVRGAVPSNALGKVLMHEHILVNFTGAAYDPDEAFQVALPKLKEIYDRGCRTLVECTPDNIGRDPVLLRRLSVASGLHILTNTGYYAAASDKYVPDHAWRESADQIARRWIREARAGIGSTGIRPAFLKLGVDAGPLSEIDRKLIQAGLITHRATRLRLHIHTGNGIAAQAILALFGKVSPAAYVWVHAQNEKDRRIHLDAARAGAWIEFDGIGPKSLDTHLDAVSDLIKAGFGDRVLISQDSGWFRPGEPGGGRFNGYTFLFDEFLPALSKRGFSSTQLLVDNPARVLAP